MFNDAASLSDAALLERVKLRARQERQSTAALIADLAEIEERRLYLSEGCATLHIYCTEVLHLSEQAAYRRGKAARLALSFPVVLERLADGSVHLSTLLLLGPYLTPQNHLELLAEATHKTKMEVAMLVARICPLPDVPSAVRKLPGTGSDPAGFLLQGNGICDSMDSMFRSHKRETSGSLPANTPPPEMEGVKGPVLAVQGLVATSQAPISPVHRPVVSPLSPERYKIQFTADAETHQALRQLQELLRHQVPSGDLAVIIKDALLRRLGQVKREKLAQAKRPRKTGGKEGAQGKVEVAKLPARVRRAEIMPGRPASRHIPAEVKREVWRRDAGRCAFVGRSGRRCSERGRLEFHHVEPYMLGGRSTTRNIELRCRAHNAYEGELIFGRWKGRPMITGDNSGDVGPPRGG
jgi:hypothetical protein